LIWPVGVRESGVQRLSWVPPETSDPEDRDLGRVPTPKTD